MREAPKHISEIDDAFREYYWSHFWPNRNDILHGTPTDHDEDGLLSAKHIWPLFQTLHTVENIWSAGDLGDYHLLQAVTEQDIQSITAVAEHRVR